MNGERKTANTRNRIALFLPSMSGGGAERAMLNLAHGLSDRGIAVDLVLAQAAGPYLDEVRFDIRLVDLGASRALSSVPGLARYLRREKPEAMLSVLDYANVLALWSRRLARSSCRLAVNEQNTISRSAPNSARRRQRLVPHLVRRFYPWADYVIGNSQGVADDLIRVTGLPPERIQILYNPVVTQDLRAKADAELDHPWFAQGQPPVILAVGRFTKQKDFPTLLKAFARVRKTQSARLMILGDGPDRAALEDRVRELGLHDDVAMPGFVQNPYAYMRRASTFVLSSRWEGLPTVLIEALYCGRRIVATDCPSGPREILAGGKWGQLTPVGDAAALAQAIEAALAGRVAPPEPESWHPYSVESVSERYIELLLNGRPTQRSGGGRLEAPAN